MTFGGQLTTLLVLIVVLGCAYFLVTVWVKRTRPPGGPTQGPGATQGFDVPVVDVPFQAGGGGKREKRFVLQGKDAETAAKVLKRMLQEGRKDGGKG